MQRGRFSALIGNHRLSPTHIEILRGLLSDDARQRWTAAELEQWTSGRRLTPKNTDAGRRRLAVSNFAGMDIGRSAPCRRDGRACVSEASKIIETVPR